ncbi:MAG: hypothetical protein KKF89_05630 [Nanoarchaeota archaeon]|nr:hypothetical protein [Nanoarchaeota archaeon]MBU1855177.1 hypothetical protein [Nanoarchaeota archaeon]
MDNSKKIESMLGTAHWIPQILGSWEKQDVEIQIVEKHQLPKEVLDKVSEKWDAVMRAVGEQEIGIEGKDWRITSAEPYSKLEIKKGDNWVLRMFARDQTRIESYFLNNQTLNLVHSPANYAESLATNNTNPWELIMKYGEREALADGHAVDVALTGLDNQGNEVMQFFKRGKGLGEYGGYIGTAAGNSMKPEMTPFDIASRELIEESRVMPFIEASTALLHESGILNSNLNLEEYKRIGLANSKFQVVEKINGGNKVRFLDRRNNESYGLLVNEESKLIMTGLALNVDPDEYYKNGNNKPHHKSEYLFLLKTKLPLQSLNDESFGWVRNDEHAGAIYIPFNHNELTEFAVEEFQNMMPPTNAVILSAIRNTFGHESYMKTLNAINNKHPVTENYPLLQVMEAGKYSQPKLLIK